MRSLKNRSLAGVIESLETRSLFSVGVGVSGVVGGNNTINGILFNDINSNTTVDVGELPNPGKTLYVDANSNNAYDAGETQTTTDANGYFTLPFLFDGTYKIRPLLAAGQTLTTLPSNITVAGGQTISGVLIGVHSAAAATGSISGIIFGDANKDGIYNGNDSIAASKTVFLDANGNDTYDAGEVKTTSSATGAYSFSNLTAGTYHVRRVFPSGWVLSSAPIDVNLSAGQNLSAQNIGSKQGSGGGGGSTGSIAGILFFDTNKNGVYNAGETLQSGKTVFIDADNDGIKDAGEKSTTTSASGAFSFGSLAAGTYRIRRVVPSGYYVTTTVPIVVNLTTGQAVSGLKIGTAASLV